MPDNEPVEDITLTASALLYCDHVHLYSITAPTLMGLVGLSGLPQHEFWQFVSNSLLVSGQSSSKQAEEILRLA